MVWSWERVDSGQGLRPRMGRPPRLEPVSVDRKGSALNFGRYFVPGTLGGGQAVVGHLEGEEVVESQRAGDLVRRSRSRSRSSRNGSPIVLEVSQTARRLASSRDSTRTRSMSLAERAFGSCPSRFKV